jgi:poly(glycerol-phosphate) alpha-glucosyltransferase
MNASDYQSDGFRSDGRATGASVTEQCRMLEKTPMRVAVLTAGVSRRAGGLFTIVRRLAQELACTGECNVEVISFTDPFAQADLSSWLPLHPRVVRGSASLLHGWGSDYIVAVMACDAELAHTQSVWLHPAFAALTWAKRTGRPYIVTTHGMLDPWALRNSRWKKKVAGWLYADAHLRNAACLQACESEARTLRAYGLGNPVCMIPNGIDLPAAGDPGPPPWEVSGRRVLLFLGRLHPKKNLPELLHAWRLAQRRSRGGKEWALVIAGWDQNGHERQLRKLSAECGIQDSVVFAGPQYGEQKAGCYFHADAFCLPSLSEGLPMAVLEAWAYGLPVVMTPECNLPEGFAAGAAIEVDTGATGIARGLLQLIEMSEGERKALGQRGRELVAGRFCWPAIAREMAAVYRWVLGGGPAPGCVRVD